MSQNTKNFLTNSKILIIAISVIIGVIFLSLVFRLGNNSTEQNQTLDLNIQDDDWAKGDSWGKAILVEYGDFQCPACKNYHPVIKQLILDIPQLKFIYRHFPLESIHKNAFAAAAASEAAGIQGKFWEMHDLLFENQTEWANSSNPDDIFGKYAEELDLDKDKFLQDYKSEEVKTKIRQDIQSGNSFNVNATPTFFLNGKKINNLRSYEQFKNLIQEAINQSND